MGRPSTRLAQALATLLAAVTAGAATADAILVSDGRRLDLYATGLGCGIEGTSFLPPAPFAPFDEDHAQATDAGGLVAGGQDSLVGNTGMGGDGIAENTSGTSHFCSLSLFSVTFQLTESTPYVLSGLLTTAFEEGFAELRLSDGGGVLFSHTASNGETRIADESGILSSGEYTLYASANGGASGTSSWSFEFQLVPEPGSAALLGAGLIALGAARRGRRLARTQSARSKVSHARGSPDS